ncbi:MAG TPA: hypothetical protein VJV75_13395 [Candidatus Polarisedimenticolia bacterium]|nr:hypothetical protein [Candidatus Polarisedimenticolia bacterium]
MAILLFQLGAVGAIRAQTADEAKAFFKDLDDHTLLSHQGRGDDLLKRIYGPDARSKVWDDINPFQTAAGIALKNLILDANGKSVPAGDKTKETDAFDALKNSGALQRLSDLQTSLVKKHFGNPPDFAKVQRSFEMFANGELRGNPGQRDMNETGQWVTWKKFAEVAISKNIDKDFWEKLLKSLQKSLEIFRTTHPGSGPDPFWGELMGKSSDFDPTKVLTDAQKTALRNAIDALTTAEILARQKSLINDMTTAMIDRQPGTTTFASIDPHTNDDGSYQVHASVLVLDGSGQPALSAHVIVHTAEIGITLPMDAYADFRTATSEGNGFYGVTLSVPSVNAGLSFSALDTTTLAGDSMGIVLRQLTPDVVSSRPIAGPAVIAGVAAALLLLGILALRARQLTPGRPGASSS